MKILNEVIPYLKGFFNACSVVSIIIVISLFWEGATIETPKYSVKVKSLKTIITKYYK